MTLPEFKRALEAALHLHFPNARLVLIPSGSCRLRCFPLLQSR